MIWPTLPKNGIVGHIQRARQRQVARQTFRPRHPLLTERHDLLRRADADELTHAERLQPIQGARRLVAEAIGRHVEQQPAIRQATAGRHQRIDRIAGRR